jgi:hypothetical protein
VKKDPLGEDVDELVRQYADADRSDTFVSYNDAIVLAKEVRRLRRQLSASKRITFKDRFGSSARLTAFKIEDADIEAIIAAARCVD